MESVEIVTRFRSAVAHRDFETAAGLIDASLRMYAPKPGLVLGRDELIAAWAEPEEEREHLTTDRELGPAESLADGRVFATTKEVNRWRESGELASETERSAIFRVEGQKIVEIRIFATTDAGRAAVGVE